MRATRVKPSLTEQIFLSGLFRCVAVKSVFQSANKSSNVVGFLV